MNTHGITFHKAGAGRAHPAKHHHPRPAGHSGRTHLGRAHVSAAAQHEQLTEQTKKWVAQTFFGQMLKQMRDSPLADKKFSGGRGGQAFQQLADQRLADHMAGGTGHKLVDAIVSRIEHPTGGGGGGGGGGGAAGGVAPQAGGAAARAGAADAGPVRGGRVGGRTAVRSLPAAAPRAGVTVAPSVAANHDWGHA